MQCKKKNTKMVSYYSYDFEGNKDEFFNIYLDDILDIAVNTEDLFDRWNKTFDREDFITCNPIFNIKPKILQYNDLIAINEDATKQLFKQFITILRLNSVSDKPNAFNKMINLFLTKIVDESEGDKDFIIEDKNGQKHKLNGLCFQYVANLDTSESFMKRLNELYKRGMEKYLNKDIIDYSDNEVEQILKSSDKQIWEMIDNLRLKKNNNFSFIEVYDDDTFKENFIIVRDIVKLFQSQQFKYDYKQQFLGDFFENLLNTSLKQEAGQFFTPYPLVDFIVASLPIQKIIDKKIKELDRELAPTMIDYACGAGHFLISAMDCVQKYFETCDTNNMNSLMLRNIKLYRENPYAWVNKKNVVGIEKDYRLAKTTKIATFLNGDGEAEIISGDGINKFNAKEYMGTVLYSRNNVIENFDLLISNPPYSVEGFMYNFQKNNIIPGDNTFSLLKKYNFSDAMIETYFVERAWQLLKNEGLAAIVLPQSVLNLSKYENLRQYIFKNFKINALLLTSDITFLGTTTSPVILFLTKDNNHENNYRTMVIYSDKYYNIKTKKSDEEKFLGYKFSADRNKSGTEQIKGISKLQKITPILHDFLMDATECNISSDLKNNVVFANIKDIIVNTEEGTQIFPKYNVVNGKSLNELNVKINPETICDSSNLKYVEISSIKNDKIIPSDKVKDSYRICLKNDILFSSLVPSSDKIILADQQYKVSKAIYILRIDDENLRMKVYNELKKDYVIKQTHSLLEGFKLTYSKIKDEKLFNYIKLNID